MSSLADIEGGAATCNNARRVVATFVGKLESFAGLVGSTFGISLPVPSSGSPADLKKFCGGLLEPSGLHPWASVMRRHCLTAVDRLSIAGSLFSFRKVLPSSTPCSVQYTKKMCTKGVSVSRPYLRFCRRETRKLFRSGWDKKWRRNVLRTTPSASSCLDVSRSTGGARRALSGSREWFLGACFTGSRLNVSTVRKVQTAQCDGKVRLVSTSPAEAVVFRPLHDMIYNHLSRYDWLLRGRALPSSFSDFHQVEGEVFVSGDFESASDNLSIEVAEAILETLLGACTRVPVGVRRAAMASLRCVLETEGFTGLQARGQLMGNYLCFPLLCLQNYLSFRWLVGRDFPVRINGDDIVFRAPEGAFGIWRDGLSELGLTLSVSKTFVHRRFFSLNSTYFRARTANGVKGVPIIRASSFYKGIESADSLSGAFTDVGEFFDERRRSQLRISFLKAKQKEIRCTQRSVRRGLAMDATAKELGAAGLYQRELFYHALVHETRPPSKAVVSGALPGGWRKWAPGLDQGPLQDDPAFQTELVRHCWSQCVTKVSTLQYWKAVRSGGPAYTPRRASWYRAKAKLLRLSLKDTRSYLQYRLRESEPRRKRVWRRKVVGTEVASVSLEEWQALYV